MADYQAGTVTYKFDIDDRDFDRKFDKNRDKVKSLGKDAEQSSKRANTAIGNIAKDSLREVNKGFNVTSRVVDKFGNSTVREFSRVEGAAKRITISQEDIASSSRFMRKQMTSNIGAVIASLENLDKKSRRSKSEMSAFRKEISEAAGAIRSLQVAFSGFTGAALIGAMTVAAGVLVELAGAAVAASGALLTVPAGLFVAAGAFAATKVGLIGVSDAFKAMASGDAEKFAEALQNLSPAAQAFVREMATLKDAFDPVRRAVQEALFQNLGDEVKRLTGGILPPLQDGLTKVAKSMNGLAREAADTISEPFFQGFMERSLAGSARAVDTLHGAITPLAEVLDRVVTAGMPFVQQFVQFITKGLQAAAAFLKTESGMATLEGRIKTGIGVLNQFGSLIGSLVTALFTLFKASESSGQTLIQTLTGIVNQFNAWASSAEGQKSLINIFTLMNQVMHQTLLVIGALAAVFVNVVDYIAQLPKPVQDATASMLALGIVMTPVIMFLARFATSLVALGPVLKFVGAKVGALGMLLIKLGAFIGRVAIQFGVLVARAVLASSRVVASWAVATGRMIAGWTRVLAMAVASATRSALAWIAEASRVSAAWVKHMAIVVATFATTVAKSTASAVVTAAVWVAQAIRVAAQWTASMATVVARQFWAGLQSQSPALAAGIVWVINAIKVAAQWTASMAVVVAQWIAAAAKSTVNAVISGAQWIAQAALTATSWVVSMATIVGAWVGAAAKSAANAIVAGATWLAQPLLIAASWIKSMAVVAATTLVAARKSTSRGIAAAATWLAQPFLIAGAWIANMATVLATQTATAVRSAAIALLASGPWIAQAAAVSLAWMLNFIKMIPFSLGAAVGIAANALIASAAWIAGAVATTAAWVIANAAILGIWGLIIAAVVGAVALVVSNWSSISAFFSNLWQGVLSVIGTVFEWVKQNWPLLLAILTGPIGIAALLIAKNIDAIKAWFANAFESVKRTWNGIVGFFTGLGSNLVQAGRDMIDGLVRGITGSKDAVVNKVKEIATGALDAVKKFFGIHSPSRVMAQMGGFMMKGLAQGISRNAGEAVRAAQSASAAAMAGFSGQPTINPSLRTGAATALQAKSADVVGGSSSTSAQPTAANRTEVHVNISGIMTGSQAGKRAVAKDLVEAINQEMRAKRLPELGNGAIPA